MSKSIHLLLQPLEGLDLERERVAKLAKPDSGRVDLTEELTDRIAEMLRGYYYCGRVWSAWSVGTMSESDFTPAEETEIPSEMAAEIAAFIAANYSHPPPRR